MGSDGTEFPKQNLGALFQGEIESPLGFCYRTRFECQSPSSGEKLDRRAFQTGALY